MRIVLAIVIGALYAGGIYMMLRRNIVKLIIGLALLSHAANLLIFIAGPVNGLVRARPPIIESDASALIAPYADPIPQALILTAIVISFGVLAFALVLVHRTYQLARTDDLDQMRTSEE
jgi:multicomponent Na+:H+ antiporter subunit C